MKFKKILQYKLTFYGDGFLMKAMHFLCSFVTASVLFGCGDSDTSNTTNHAVAAAPILELNSAPIISGATRTELMATQSQRIELLISDDDGDVITLSISESITWASVERLGDHAVVIINPGFFDLGEHTLTVTVSDGQTPTVHELDIAVTDNPDAYQEIALNQQILTGNWVFDNGSELHLYGNNRGLYRSNSQEDYFPLTWDIPDKNHGHIIVNQQACGTCWRPQDAFSIEVVAQDGNQIRARFMEGEELRDTSNGKTIAQTLSPLHFSPIDNDPIQFFSYLGASNRNRASYINAATQKFEIVAPVPLMTSHDNHWPDAILSGTFTQANNQFQFHPDPAHHALSDIFVRFHHADSGILEGLYFNYVMESLEPAFVSDSLQIFKAVLRPQLDTQHEHAVMEDYPDAAEFMADKLTLWFELQPLSPVEHIDLQIGTPYYSVFQYKDEFKLSNRTFDLTNASQLVLDSDSKAHFVIDSAHEPGSITRAEVDVSTAGNIMQLSYGDTSQRYGFYRNVKGQLLNVWLSNKGEMTIFPFLDAAPGVRDIAFSDLTDLFLMIDGRGIHEQNEHFLSYTPSTNSAGFRAQSHIGEELSDNSLNLAMSFGADIRSYCDGLSYDDCIAQELSGFLENSERPFVERRLKLIHIQENRYFFQSSETYYIDGFLFSSNQIREMVWLGF